MAVSMVVSMVVLIVFWWCFDGDFRWFALQTISSLENRPRKLSRGDGEHHLSTGIYRKPGNLEWENHQKIGGFNHRKITSWSLQNWESSLCSPLRCWGWHPLSWGNLRHVSIITSANRDVWTDRASNNDENCRFSREVLRIEKQKSGNRAN